MKVLLILPIRFYQLAISPIMAPHCRFHPTCSAYAIEAISRFGAAKGSYLACRRLMRCHPWASGGIDVVPESFSFRATAHFGKAS
jgi:putative membrane protein insertion efficiency factor